MKENKLQCSTFFLHLLAMAAMLLDHLWATVLPGCLWLNVIGRIAFPLFAFLAAEGFFHTGSFKKYLLRLFLFALLSEIPFDLMHSGTFFDPFCQNVLWTLLLGLVSVKAIDTIRRQKSLWLRIPAVFLIAFSGFLLGFAGFVDYYGIGVLTVILFYIFHGRSWYHFAGQAAGLFIFNVLMLGGQDLVFSFGAGEIYLPIQGFALFALLPIWLYRGRQGLHNKFFQYSCYAFYPLHMLILALCALYG